LVLARAFLTCVRAESGFPFDSSKLGSFLAHLDDIEARLTASGKVPRIGPDGRAERSWRETCADRGHRPMCGTPTSCNLQYRREQDRAEHEASVAAAGGADAFAAKQRESIRELRERVNGRRSA
jgi:hypothetical protein